MKVLLVDDSKLVRRLIKRILSKQYTNLIFFEANNGEEALKVLEHEVVDVMFLDWNMPVLGGSALMKYLCNEHLHIFMNLHVIVITAESYKKEIESIFRQGVDNLLIKPFAPEKILGAFEACFKEQMRV